MSTITIEQPTGAMRVRQPQSIGRFYIVYCNKYHLRFLTTCIDETPDGTPKRMRVQHSVSHGGEVLQPCDYEIIERDPMWED